MTLQQRIVVLGLIDELKSSKANIAFSCAAFEHLDSIVISKTIKGEWTPGITDDECVIVINGYINCVQELNKMIKQFKEWKNE